MQQLDQADHKGKSNDSVPAFLPTSLIAGLIFLSVLVGVGRNTGLGLVQLALLADGLTIAILWRRLPTSTLRSLLVASFAIGLWSFMALTLFAAAAAHFPSLLPWNQFALVVGMGVLAMTSGCAGILWATHKSTQMQLQIFLTTGISVAMALALLVFSGADKSLSANAARSVANHQDNHPSTNHHNDDPDPSSSKHDVAGHDEHGLAANQHVIGLDSKSKSTRNPVAPVIPHNQEHSAQAHAAPIQQDDRPTAHQNPAKAIHWTYHGATGPNQWGRLNSEWNLCEDGLQQSPVNIPSSANESKLAIKLIYRPSRATIVDNGHTIQVNVEPGNSAIINNKLFELKQFHFHSPSEHETESLSYPVEVHFVHADKTGRLAVIGAFITRGPSSREWQQIFSALPSGSGQEEVLGELLDVGRILPKNLTAVQYVGSLTTPPCSEGVLWSVLKTPISMSNDNIQIFRERYANSNRPVMPIGMRQFGPISRDSFEEANLSH